MANGYAQVSSSPTPVLPEPPQDVICISRYIATAFEWIPQRTSETEEYVCDALG